MDWESLLNKRPIVVAVAGSNGAGKSTFYHAHLASAAWRYINADDIAAELDLGAYEAADIAAAIRGELFEQGESLVFETVFSDPEGAKVAELEAAAGKRDTCHFDIHPNRFIRDVQTTRFDAGDAGRPRCAR